MNTGYDVKLFPSFGGEFISDVDPHYVYRPEVFEVIKEYKNTNSIPESIEIKIRSLIEAQYNYFKRNGKYATCNEELCATKEVTIEGNDSTYNIYIDCDNYKIGYNHFIGNIRKIRKIPGNVLDISAELAILKYVKKDLFKDSFYLSSYPDVDISSYVNSNGEMIIKAVNKKENKRYELNKTTGILYSVSNIPFETITKDQLNDNAFDFIKYKQVVFDYTPLLTNVKRYLQEDRPDIVYVADLPTLPIGNILKKVTGCKLIIDCHEWWKEQSVLWEPHMKAKIDIIDEYEKMLYNECDMHITVGKHLAHSMSKYFNLEFGTIYSCLSDSLTINSDEKEENFWGGRYGLPKGAKVLLFQGSLTTLRNLDNLARATRYFDDGIYLAIVGGGSYEMEFRRILKGEGKEGRVIFAGWVPQKELMQYTINADLGIIPYVAVNEYFSMSLPNKAIELFSACLPIICDKTLKEVSKIVSDNNVGVAIDCSDPEEIGRTVNRLFKEDKLLQVYKESYNDCRDLFSYKKQADEFSRLLDSNIKGWK